MDKEDVVHIYNGILLRHKKERNWVIFRGVDGPGGGQRKTNTVCFHLHVRSKK